MDRSAWRSRLAASLVASSAVVFGGRARAQGAADPAAAQALFDDAKRLMDAGHFAEACPKLAESERLDPGGGTTLVLAMCHEGEGKIATAWANYTQAVAEARRDRRSDREKAATAKVNALAPRLSRVRIVADKAAPGLEIKRDGVTVGQAQWATPLPIDPGTYAFDATAPGRKPWHGTLKVEGEGKVFDVLVPPLETAPVEANPAPSPAGGEAKRVTSPAPTNDEGSNRLLVTGIVGGASVLTLGVGLVVGLTAQTKWNSTTSSCPNGRCPTQALVDQGKSAGSRADVATVLVGIGAAGLVTAGVLYFAWPTKSSSSEAVAIAPYAAPGGAGVFVRGAL